MPRRWICLGLAAIAWMSLACGGMGLEAEDAPCCTVDDVIALTQEGVADAVVIATLRTSGTDLDLSAAEIVRLNGAGVSGPVIDVLNGGPCVCEEIEPEVAATPATASTPAGKKPVPTGLKLAIKYTGGKSMEVVNLSRSNYTGVTVLLNDEYQYRLKKLKGNAADHMRFSSFVSRKTGAEARRLKLKKVVVTADQGSYTARF